MPVEGFVPRITIIPYYSKVYNRYTFNIFCAKQHNKRNQG